MNRDRRADRGNGDNASAVPQSELIEGLGWTSTPTMDGFYFMLEQGAARPTIIDVYGLDVDVPRFEIIGNDIDFDLNEAIENGCIFYPITMPPNETEVTAVVFSNGREAHFWLPDGMHLPHMSKIKCKIIVKP